MLKNNSRSFRFSDKTLHQLESFEGGSLSEKFENMVNLCCLEQDKVKASIVSQKAELEKLRKQCAAQRNNLSQLVEMERYKGTLILCMGDLMQKLRQFTQMVEGEV